MFMSPGLGWIGVWCSLVVVAGGCRCLRYAFQRRRFWLSSGSAGLGDPAGLGLAGAEHALLGAVVHAPDSGGVVLTGRVSLGTHPWLADHAVLGAVIFPGAGFVELVLRAADEVGCGGIDELMLAAPLVLVEGGAVDVQVVVGAAGESGVRAVSVYSRPAQVDSEWLLHAEGSLVVDCAPPLLDLSVWPPTGAVAVDVSTAYEQLAERGYQYGPAFQGLQAVWRRGDEVFAEVALPDISGVDVSGLGVHPALLDAALHAAGLVEGSSAGEVLVPFSWQQVALHASGATRLRARLVRHGATVAVELADGTGLPVLSVGSLATRPVSLEQLQAAVSADAAEHDVLQVAWAPIPAPAVAVDGSGGPVVVAWNDFHTAHDHAPDDAVLGDGAVVVWECGLSGTADSGVVGAVYAGAHAVLEVLQGWLADERAGSLVVLTRGAVGLPGEDITDLAGAAVWGLVRSAQSEHPGRVTLIDTEIDAAVDVAGLVSVGEPQLLVRGGDVYAARLVPASPKTPLTVPDSDTPWRLAVGGTGTLDDLALSGRLDIQQPLQSGQVRVALRAIGVNFRDVLMALGMYPDGSGVGCRGCWGGGGGWCRGHRFGRW